MLNTFLLLVGLCGLNADFKELVITNRPDEALAISKMCHFDGQFFFYKAVAHFKIKEYSLAVRSAEQALFYKDLPERYSDVLHRLIAATESIKERKDKNEDIASDMKVVEERLSANKGGSKTQMIQKKIISKLDEQISEIEDQMKKAQESASSGPRIEQGAPESRVMQDPSPKGEISNRQLILSKENWGKIPEKEKIKALQAINKSLDPYRREAAEGFTKILQNGPHK